MSESISSASQTISTQLTEMSANAILNIRYLLFVLVILVVFMFYMSSMFSITISAAAHKCSKYSRCSKCQRKSPLQYRCAMANADTTEHFTQVLSSSHLDFQSIPLTAPDSSSNHPSHLMFGQADRHINDDRYSLKISANLYVLNGNIFNQKENVQQSYNAYLINKDNTKLKIGDLKKDGDGLYKLSFSSQERNKLETYKYLAIFYNDETPLLVGSFS
jgi:hypothetical protein